MSTLQFNSANSMKTDEKQMRVRKVTDRIKILEILELFAYSLDSLAQGEEFRLHMAEKFSLFGNVVVLVDHEKVCAFSAFYANDSESCTGFLSMIAVLPEYRGRCYADVLLETVCCIASEKGMDHMRLEVKRNNIPAIHLYWKHHFVILEKRSDTFIMDRRIKDREYE